MKRFLAVFFARNLEFFRDRATLFWNILFPVFLIFGFAFAFSGKNTISYKSELSANRKIKLNFLITSILNSFRMTH